jgi:hypothetical protein
MIARHFGLQKKVDHYFLAPFDVLPPLDAQIFCGSWARSQNCERRLLASSRMSVCPSVRLPARMNNSAPRTDFHEI